MGGKSGGGARTSTIEKIHYMARIDQNMLILFQAVRFLALSMAMMSR